MLRDLAVVLLAFVLAGLAAGVAWSLLADPVEVVRTESGLSTGEVALGNRFDSDAWYSVLAAVAGLVLGVWLSVWRRAHEVVTLLAVVGGALLAAWVSVWLGGVLGPDDPAKVLADARPGASASDRLVVSSSAAYLVWPIAALVGSLVVLWSPPGRSLARRG